MGTSFYALRLSEFDRLSLANAKRQLVERWADNSGLAAEARDHYFAAQLCECPIGPEWINGKWLPEEVEMCRRAYDFAD
jgi:hypothetical protein